MPYKLLQDGASLISTGRTMFPCDADMFHKLVPVPTCACVGGPLSSYITVLNNASDACATVNLQQPLPHLYLALQSHKSKPCHSFQRQCGTAPEQQGMALPVPPVSEGDPIDRGREGRYATTLVHTMDRRITTEQANIIEPQWHTLKY